MQLLKTTTASPWIPMGNSVPRLAWVGFFFFFFKWLGSFPSKAGVHHRQAFFAEPKSKRCGWNKTTFHSTSHYKRVWKKEQIVHSREYLNWVLSQLTLYYNGSHPNWKVTQLKHQFSSGVWHEIFTQLSCSEISAPKYQVQVSTDYCSALAGHYGTQWIAVNTSGLFINHHITKQSSRYLQSKLRGTQKPSYQPLEAQLG